MTQINNLCYLRVKLGNFYFKCISKTPPKIKDAPTWNILTDDPDVPTGVTYKGKSEGYDTFSVTIPTDFDLVYNAIQDMILADEVYDIAFEYYPGGYAAGATPTTKVVMPSCYVLGCNVEGGENNGNSTTEVTFQARGGYKPNLAHTGTPGSGTPDPDAADLAGMTLNGSGQYVPEGSGS